VLHRSGEKFTDPDNLLEAFLLADLKNDLLGITKLVRRESIAPVYEERNVVFPSNERRSWNFVDGTPRKSKRSRLAERIGRQIQQPTTYYR
jgi:hypothetical protein